MKKVIYFCDRCEKETTSPPFKWPQDEDGFLVLSNQAKGVFSISIRINQRAPTMPHAEWVVPDLCRDCIRELVTEALREEMDARGD